MGIVYDVKKDGKVVQEGVIDGDNPIIFNGKSCIIYGCSKYSDLGCY
jgi:hypothetical protein